MYEQVLVALDYNQKSLEHYRAMRATVDLEGGLDEIANTLQDGGYSNEYDLQLDIYKLMVSAHDGHLNFNPDIKSVFYFMRENNLVSVSKDGLALPEVYLDLDLPMLSGRSNGTKYTASPVSSINGEPVETFLNDLATASGNMQDPDANYNHLFPILPLAIIQQDFPYFQYPELYPGVDTVIAFKNGSTRHIKTTAGANADFSGVTDGKSFFRKFCSGDVPVSSAIAASSSVVPSSVAPSAYPSTGAAYSAVASQTAVPALPPYPKPWAIASDLSIGCYFPKDNEDLTVLSVPTFDPAIGSEFSDTTRQCLATATKLGRTKLMIDLRGNGGGSVPLAYDMFKQLFPSKQPWGTTNFRAFPLFNEIGKFVTKEYANTTDEEAGPAEFQNNFSSIFNGGEQDDVMLVEYDTWAEFYGPVEAHGDTFTNLVRYNLSDPYDLSKMQVSGYGNWTDGTCGSTCAVFSEFMKTQANIRQVVMGGRKQDGPMQGVGGVKGANVYRFDYLYQMISTAAAEAPPDVRKTLMEEYGMDVRAAAHANERAALTSEGYRLARVNVRNNIRKGDETLTPLQFVYEAADCRLFYKARMMYDQSLVWQAASEAYWGDGACVEGSTGHPSSEPGVGYFLQSVDGEGPSPSSSGSSTGTGASATSTASEGVGSVAKTAGSVVGLAAAAFAFMLV
ncbi:hypothetical protein LTR37_006449 [Vermiconidia calcicola]|uniref:Uncharacterized protein n=1 Tax=Vermiconidia calcicola TaxID=1690605 RepID=A0ACC3NGG3_9PEZI|nr:hypothetical protein LTR37_006449 [Vermiconidia calcicola]